MPFTKIVAGKDAGKYRSPSGRVWTKGQMKAYLAKKHGQGKNQKK